MVLIFVKRKAALPVILKNNIKCKRYVIQNLSLLQVGLYDNNIRLGFE